MTDAPFTCRLCTQPLDTQWRNETHEGVRTCRDCFQQWDQDDKPLTHELLDLITLMPDSQTQEILDYIVELRAIRAAHAANRETT